MLQIINPRPLQLSHSGGPGETNVDIVVNCWENARPLIKELEQTVNFAERKCGDLMQQLNLCKEYYEKWSNERCNTATSLHKKKTRKSYGRKVDSDSSSEDEYLKLSSREVFNEKIRNKIFEITNEIKEANRKIVKKETCFGSCRKRSTNSEPGSQTRQIIGNRTEDVSKHSTKSETTMNSGNQRDQRDSTVIRRTQSRVSYKKRQPVSVKRHAMQKYKLRSKSLPQGVRRKFGFGSFVEIVDNQRSGVQKVKSRGTISSGSKSNLRGERGRPKSRSAEKLRTRNRNKSSHGVILDKPNPSKAHLEAQNHSESSVNPSEIPTQNIRSFSNFSCDFGSTQIKPSPGYITEVNDAKTVKSDTSFTGKKSLALTLRQPIPFTICRTTKTFNLGLNIQQVLSLIKSKRHSAMLQAIIKDNIQSARSVIHKTEPNVNALYIATSSRLARTADSETCPVREDPDRCYSVISSSGETKCKMLTCRRSIGEEEAFSVCESPSMPLHIEIQRPEDVWVVEQPDSHQSVQRYRSRCTCFPNRNSVDYQKVLKQYSTIRQSEEKTNFPASFSGFTSGYVMTGTELCSLTSESRTNTKLELKRVQEDFDNLIRRFERIQDHVTQNGVIDYEVDAELDALELELAYREEDWKTILNHYNQLINLKRKVSDLRGRIRSSSNIAELTGKTSRTRRDPFRPTPSMTLTRVLRQIQCLQDKIKLIDSPSTTL